MHSLILKVMSPRGRAFVVVYRRIKPHLLMVFVQMAVTILYFLTEASFNYEMNPHVYVTYRHALGGIVVFPFAYVLERKMMPKMTMAMFLELNLLSLFGVTLSLNMYFVSLKYTSAPFVTSMANTVSSFTFILAVALKLETLDVKNPRDWAKIFGTLLSLTGALTMSLYKGHAIKSLQGAPIHIRGSFVHSSWIKGSILTVASCISWSFSYIMQAMAVKKYPAQLLLTVWINFLGAAQSAVFTVFMQLKSKAWSTKSTIELCCILYSGIVSCGLIIFIQLWTMEQKGPVFVSMFNPLGTILVTILAYFLLGEQLHMGSVMGGAIVILGLYLLLWGKEGDQNQIKSQQQSISTPDNMTEIVTTAEQEAR